MNTAERLCQKIFNHIGKLEPLQEITNEAGYFKILNCPNTGERVGDIRLFKGSAIVDIVVIVHINKTSINLDAYMVTAFTRPDSLYPHLAFDAELQPHDSAFHIDLLHKVDCSTDSDYITHILEPLTEAFEEADNNPNFRFSDATRHMKTLLNPWMASYHTQPAHLTEAEQTIDAYAHYWLSLKDAHAERLGLHQNTIDVNAYDKARRKALYNPRVDVLWDMLVNLIGLENRDLILQIAQGTYNLK